ncbi:MAG: hypothetical protein LIO72_00765 [Ruminococcus sp.]|nr:hypothetical protein [Ruminococcus sp.]
MSLNEKFDDIIDMERPWPEEVLKKHPKMPPQDRAKIFAPFAALRGHSERIGEEDVKLMWSERVELSEDGAKALSDKVLRVRKGMEVDVVFFTPDAENDDIGYNVTTAGRVTGIDEVYRTMRISEDGVTDFVISFDNLIDIKERDL